MKTVEVVGAVIRNERNEVLCALRSASMSAPSQWEFPGGKIEQGESPRESLIREIKEELNCTITVGSLVADAVHEEPNRRIRLRTYEARIVEGRPVPREHEKLLWLPGEELIRLKWAEADLPTVNKMTASVTSEAAPGAPR